MELKRQPPFDSRDTRTPDGRPPEAQPKWRGDFPIDVADDEFGARRDFTKFSVLVSLAFVVGQGWIAVKSMFRRRQKAPAPQRIAAVDEIPVGTARLFHYPTEHDPCLLLRTSDDVFIAYGNQCTHLMCAVVPEFDRERLHCPCHAGYFDMATGHPIAGPPRRPLAQVKLEIRDGAVYATAVELRTT